MLIVLILKKSLPLCSVVPFSTFLSFSLPFFLLSSFLSFLPPFCCCCSVTKLCPALWGFMDYSTPGFLVLHYLPEFAQTHVLWACDAIPPSPPLCLPLLLPSTFPITSLFQWVGSSHHVTEELELEPQHQSFQWTLRADLLQNWPVRSPQHPRDSRESPPAPPFQSMDSSALSPLCGLLSHLYVITGKKIGPTIFFPIYFSRSHV